MADYINDIKNREVQQQQTDNLWWLTPAAMGLGAIALGSYIYKSVGKQGGNVVANMLHFLGRPRGEGINVDLLANPGAMAPASGTSGVRSFLSATFNVSKQKVQLGPIDLVQDLTRSLEILGDTSGTVRNRITSKVTEAINRRYSNYGNNTSFFTDNLQRITLNEVITNDGTWRTLIGDDQWTAIKSAIDTNLISGDTFLDKNIYKTQSGFLRDTRFRNLLSSVNSEGNRVSRFDLFGQSRVIKSIFGTKPAVARLGPSYRVAGPSYFIDGDVFAYTKRGNTVTEHLVATGQRLRETGDPLEPIRAAREGRLRYNLKVRSGAVGKAITKFEEVTGVGTSFKNRYSLYERWITHPIQRLKGLVSGTGQIRSKTITNHHSRLLDFIDETVGADYPELVTGRPRPVATIGGRVELQSMSAYEQILTILGRSSKYEVIKSSSARHYDDMVSAGIHPILKDKDRFIARPPTGGFDILNVSGDAANLPRRPGGRHGSIGKYYTVPESKIVPGATSTRDFASYMMYRVSHLASDSLLGISFAPAKSLLGNMARLAAIPVIYEAGRQAALYADYVAEEVTGISPIKMAASAYAMLRETQQRVRQGLGIQQGLAALETNYPGSVNSGLATVARSIVAPGLTFGMLSRFGVGKAIAGAAGVFGLIGGPSPDQSPEALEKEYAGETKVPIRKGRWWSLGYQPFEGGDIERFDHSWYHKLMSGAKTKSIYGSESEYWKYHANVFGIPLPTPSNLFGLRNLLNPYRLEEINKDTRPYEETSTALSEVPIFGPVLGETIGRLLKPKIYREPSMTLYKAGVVPGGVTADTAMSLGMTPLEISDVRIDTPVDKLYKMADVAMEPAGVYKFVMEYFGIDLSPKNQQIATSSNIDSAGKSLYAANLGGLFGQCFIAGTLVETERGRIPIEQVVPGDKALSADGLYRTVNYRFEKESNDLYKLDIANICTTLTGTGNHKIASYRFYPCHDKNSAPCVPGNRSKKCLKCIKPDKTIKIEDVYLKDLKPKDYVCIPIIQPKEDYPTIDLAKCSNRAFTTNWIYSRGSTDFANAYETVEAGSSLTRSQLRELGFTDEIGKEALISFKRGTVSRFKRYVKLDKDLAYILGWWVAEGNSEINGKIQYSMNRNEFEYAKEIAKIIKDKFDANSSFEFRDEHGLNLHSCSVELSMLVTELFGSGAGNKHIPSIIKSMPVEGLREFFKGAVLGDGWTDIKNENAGYTSKSARLCRDILDVSLSLGINGSLTLDYLEIPKKGSFYPQGTPREPTTRSYVQWQKINDAIKVHNILYNTNFSEHNTKKDSRSFIQDGYLFVRVQSIIKIQTDPVKVYDLEIEGLHYYTANQILVHNSEFLRRFMLSDYNSVSRIAGQVNRLTNSMPDWLPGEDSKFARDKNYSLNFQRGNPFDKISNAESRLPGVGYESLNELESGKPGVYSDVDRFLILSDVAPYSEAYGHYEKKVSSLVLDEKWKNRVEQAKEYRRKVTSIDNRYPRYTDEIDALNKHIQDSSLYKTTRTAYDFITHDILAEIPLIGSKLAPFRNPYEQYRKRQVEGSEFASWYTPWEDIQRPAITDIALSNPIMGAVKGGTIGWLLSTPMLSFASPFLTAGPVSSITAGAIAGGALSLGRMGLGVPDNYVPEYTRNQSETFKYLDALNYTKARTLEQLAISQGVDSSEFKKMARKTMIGANTPIMLRASLPTSTDKKYFDVFLNTPQSQRSELIAGVSPHMAAALNKAWSFNYNSQYNADEEAISYLSDKSIPSYDSQLWNPMVDSKSMGFKLVSHGLDGVSDNYHKYGFYEGHEATLRSRMPDLWNENVQFISPPNHHQKREYFNSLAQNIAGTFKSSMSSTPYGARYTHRLQIDRSNETLQVVQGRY